jgi:uncharacterized membrane protein (DUF485 family)
MLASAEFRHLVTRRWTVSVVLTATLFLVYYGYILLIAANRSFVARPIGDGVTTLGIPLGIAVIVLSWALTALYVVWANRSYDTEVDRLRSLTHGASAEPPR